MDLFCYFVKDKIRAHVIKKMTITFVNRDIGYILETSLKVKRYLSDDERYS